MNLLGILENFSVGLLRYRLNRNIDKVFSQLAKKRTVITKEVVYPVYRFCKGKYLWKTGLPVIEIQEEVKYTQVSCPPLEFRPSNELYN